MHTLSDLYQKIISLQWNGSMALSSSDSPATDCYQLAQKLMDNPAKSIRLIAQSDQKGSATYNYQLSEKRARYTRDYLVYLRGKIGAHLEEGGGLAEAYYVDQSPYAGLDTFEELATKNAGRVFEQMEFE